MDTKKLWDYRVVRKESMDLGGPYEWYSIQEVYYDDETGDPIAQSMDLVVEQDTITGMRTQLEKMIKCLSQPILDENDIINNVVPNEPDGLEVGPWEGIVHTGENNKTYIYESSDGGKTLYRRKLGKSKREKSSTKEWQSDVDKNRGL